MRNPPERSLDAPEDHGQPWERLPSEIRVDDGSAVRSHARATTGRILIFGADLFLRGESIQHRIEISGADADEQPRPTHASDVRRIAPARLRHEPDPKSAPFEKLGNEDRP